jgi:hypothetical protein
LEEALLGHPGTLVMMEAGDVPRVVHGVVTGYEVPARSIATRCASS